MYKFCEEKYSLQMCVVKKNVFISLSKHEKDYVTNRIHDLDTIQICTETDISRIDSLYMKKSSFAVLLENNFLLRIQKALFLNSYLKKRRIKTDHCVEYNSLYKENFIEKWPRSKLQK